MFHVVQALWASHMYSHRGIRRIRNAFIIIIMLLLLLWDDDDDDDVVAVAVVVIIIILHRSTDLETGFFFFNPLTCTRTVTQAPTDADCGWQPTYLKDSVPGPVQRKMPLGLQPSRLPGQTEQVQLPQWRTAQETLYETFVLLQVTRDNYLWSVYRFLWWGV